MWKQILIVAAIGTGVATASAATITFDDLSAAPDIGSVIANGYNGFDWDNFSVMSGPAYTTPDTGYQHGVVSPDNIIYNRSGSPASFSRSTPFTFNSVFLTRAWDKGVIRFEGFNGLDSLYSMDIVAGTVSPTFATFNWKGITKVVITSLAGDKNYLSQAVLDNLTFDDGSVSAVPLPAAALLLGSGLLGMVGVGCKKKPAEEQAEALA